MIPRIFFVCLVTLLVITGTLREVAAQTPSDFEGALVYMRKVGDVYEYIRLTPDTRISYPFPADRCTFVSPGSIYIAQSSPDPSELTIRSFPSDTVIIQTSWNPDWEPCRLIWKSDTLLRIRREGGNQEFYNFDISQGTLESVDYQPPPTPEYPSLPGWEPETDSHFILPSPQSGIYLYERCASTRVSGTTVVCVPPIEYVIYDVTQQAVLHVLEDPDPELVPGYDVLGRYVSYGAVWSTSGRYLAFERLNITLNRFNLEIYDVAADRYLDTEYFNVQIDSRLAMQWSPVGNTLAFWIKGRLGEPQEGDDWSTLRTLIFYDADPEVPEFVDTDQPYNLDWDYWGQRGIWSPAGQGFAFVDLTDTLIYVDSNTGASAALDTDVEYIVSWRPLQQ